MARPEGDHTLGRGTGTVRRLIVLLLVANDVAVGEPLSIVAYLAQVADGADPVANIYLNRERAIGL